MSSSSSKNVRVRFPLQDTILVYDAEKMRYRAITQDERLLLWMYTVNVNTKEFFLPISEGEKAQGQELCPLCHQRKAHVFVKHTNNLGCQEHHACTHCLSTWLSMGCHFNCPFCREIFRPETITLCSIQSQT